MNERRDCLIEFTQERKPISANTLFKKKKKKKKPNQTNKLKPNPDSTRGSRHMEKQNPRQILLSKKEKKVMNCKWITKADVLSNRKFAGMTKIK